MYLTLSLLFNREMEWNLGRKGMMHIPLHYQIIVQSQFKYKQELINLDFSAEKEKSIGWPNSEGQNMNWLKNMDWSVYEKCD